MHSIALLWPAEWDVIYKMFLVDHVISIYRIHDKTQDNGIVQYQTHPGEINDSSFFEVPQTDVVFLM